MSFAKRRVVSSHDGEEQPLQRDLVEPEQGFKTPASALLVSFDPAQTFKLTMMRQHRNSGHCTMSRLSMPEAEDVAPRRRYH